MPPLITATDLRMGFRGPPLLDGVSCQIDTNQRIGLLGRNGSGKTTFMRILSGQVRPDAGKVLLAPGAAVALLPQDVPTDIAGPVMSIITSGLEAALSHHESNWEGEQRAERLIENMELPSDAPFESLSSGMKRRVLLARALVSSPDVLLLDEPTNHLDVAAIAWLEDFLLRCRTSLLFVTHDRAFLRRLSTRIIELDRGRLFDWSCDYDTFLVRKEQALAAEEKQNALFDKRLAEEEVWIRTGIKARRTRNEGRVRRLEDMRRARSERRDKPGKVKLNIQEAERSGALVAEAKSVGFSYGDRTIFSDLSTQIFRGDKIGVIGRNGAGKTTLLRVLLGQLEPTEGSIRLGTNLQIAYFDQLRQQLDDEKSVQENVGEGYDSVVINGKSKHVIGYLRDFLFTPDRARTPVKFLSGGERNRILLAKLFAKPANVLVLDEPTNDLDAETLEMLEERIEEFDGAVLLVSHDRQFLNNVVGSTIVFEGDNVVEYVGGYDDWIRQRGEGPATLFAGGASAKKTAKSESPATKSAGDSPATTETSPVKSSAKRKPSYKERKERDDLPALIEKLETTIGAIHAEMADSKFYQQDNGRIADTGNRLKEAQQKLEKAFVRWDELEQLAE